MGRRRTATACVAGPRAPHHPPVMVAVKVPRQRPDPLTADDELGAARLAKQKVAHVPDGPEVALHAVSPPPGLKHPVDVVGHALHPRRVEVPKARTLGRVVPRLKLGVVQDVEDAADVRKRLYIVLVDDNDVHGQQIVEFRDEFQ